MHKRIGRIIARGNNIAGLFMPFGDCSLHGIYEITEIMGELTVERVGDPAMRLEQFEGMDLESLHIYRKEACMTQEELDKVSVSSRFKSD